jgi:hypothetical protein
MNIVDLASVNQIKCINSLLTKLGLRERKTELVLGSSGERTKSTKELTLDEAKALISYLKSQDAEEVKAEKMRKKIISLAHEMHWHLPNSTKADMQRIDAWCKKYSPKHKSLNNHTYKELPALISQFERVYSSFLKSI